jgi:hypothetical protein
MRRADYNSNPSRGQGARPGFEGNFVNREGMRRERSADFQIDFQIRSGWEKRGCPDWSGVLAWVRVGECGSRGGTAKSAKDANA